MSKSLVSRIGLAVAISTALVACASTEDDASDNAGGAAESAATAKASFPKVGASYDIPLQPGVINTITIKDDGRYEFIERSGGRDLHCEGTYASVGGGRVLVGHLRCAGVDVPFTQVLELPSGKTSLCKGVDVQIRSTLFGGLKESYPTTLTEKCQ